MTSQLSGQTSLKRGQTSLRGGQTSVSSLRKGGPKLEPLPVPVVMYGYSDAPGSNNLVVANGTGTVDTAGHLEGSGQLQLKATGSSAPSATKTGSGVFAGNPEDMGTISLLIDYGDDPEYMSVTGVDKRLGRGGSYLTTAGITTTTNSNLTSGRRWENFHISEAANVVALGAGQFDLRAQLSHVAPYAETVKIDAAVRNSQGRPTFLLGQDDARVDLVRPSDGIIALVKQHCRPLLKHIMAFPPMGLLGDTPTRMVGADLQYAHSEGVKICLNLTPDDNPITSYADPAAVVSAWQSQFPMLAALGLETDNKFEVVASNGALRAAGASVTKTITANGSATVTLTDTSGVANGQKAAGIGVPSGTTVISFVANTSITFSQNIPSTTTSISVTTTSGAFHTGKLWPVASAAGVKTIRQTNAGIVPTRGGIGSRCQAFPALSGSGLTAAAAIAQIDIAILRGNAIEVYLHTLNEALSSGLDMKPSELVLLLQYLHAKYLSGLIVFASRKELGERDGYDAHWPMAA